MATTESNLTMSALRAMMQQALEKKKQQGGAIPGGMAGAARYVGVGRVTFWRGVKEGRWPAGRLVSARRRVWLTHELDAALAAAAE